MKDEIHEKLIALTEEEKQILSGEIEIKKEIYTDNRQFIIDSDKFLSKGELIDIRRHTRFVKFPKHKHNYLEFNYVYQGNLIEIVDDKKIHLKKGEIIFLNQYIDHEIEAASESDISINFIIKPKFFDYVFNLLENDNVISEFLISSIYTTYNQGEYLYFKSSEDKNIQKLLEKIITEIYSYDIMSKVSIKLLVGLLIVELVRNPENIEVYSVNNYERMLIIKVLRYIDEFYVNGSLNEIADKLKQPHYKLSKLIKKHTKLTFKELLQEKKINKASELLKLSEFSVLNVMEKIGYENPTYFYKIFKEKYGMTPKEYKNNFNNV